MGTGRRRAYNKGMGLLGLLGDQGNEMMADLFFFSFHTLGLYPSPWRWHQLFCGREYTVYLARAACTYPWTPIPLRDGAINRGHSVCQNPEPQTSSISGNGHNACWVPQPGHFHFRVRTASAD